MRSVTLPNGLRIVAPNRTEAAVLYHEIFVLRTYLQHGVLVKDGDCVFDVGANVGLFTVFLSRSYQDLQIFAFEPLPQSFELLRVNAALHGSGSRLRLFNHGLSKRGGTATFEIDRFATLAATMYPEYLSAGARRDAGARDWTRAAILDLERLALLPRGLARRLLAALETPALGFLIAGAGLLLLLALDARKRLFLRRAECRLRTPSEVIEEHALTAVDLVKIDVEGSELDVILGIEERDWPKIRQLVIEVHDIDGRVRAITALLESRGYQTTLDQEDWELHKLINAHTLYAIRR